MRVICPPRAAIFALTRCVIIELITHLMEARMTLQNRPAVHVASTLTDDQRRRVADALESAQSETLAGTTQASSGNSGHGASRESYSTLPVQPEVLAAYAVELADDGKSMSTIRLAIAAIVDAHRSVGLESPQTAGVTETLRGCRGNSGSARSRRDRSMPMPWLRSGRRRSIPEGREVVRSRWKKRFSGAAGWTSPWRQ